MAIATTSTLAIIEQDNTFLFVQETKERHRGKFSLPGGGIEHGETPEEAVVREVQEETGLIVEVDRLLGVFYRYKVEPHDRPNVAFLYHCQVTGGQVGPSDEHPIVEWFSLKQLHELAQRQVLRTPHLYGLIERYRAGQLGREQIVTLFD